MPKTINGGLGLFIDKADLERFLAGLKDHQDRKDGNPDQGNELPVFDILANREKLPVTDYFGCVQHGKVVQSSACWQQVGFDDGTYFIHPVVTQDDR